MSLRAGQKIGVSVRGGGASQFIDSPPPPEAPIFPRFWGGFSPPFLDNIELIVESLNINVLRMGFQVPSVEKKTPPAGKLKGSNLEMRRTVDERELRWRKNNGNPFSASEPEAKTERSQS